LPCVSRRPGLRTDGDGASRTNPGVLVTHASTLSQSAVGLPGCVQRRQARDPPGCNTETRQLRLGRSALTRGPAAPAAELSPAATTCAAAGHSDAMLLPAPAVRQGKTKLTWVVPGAAPKPLGRRHKLRRHSRVINLHACIACQCRPPWCAWARVCPLLCMCARVRVPRFVRCWCVGVSVGAGVGAWVLLCACARVCLDMSPRLSQN
jgi:hypothetical protein